MVDTVGNGTVAAVNNKLYKAAGTITLEFKATIVPGTSGRADGPGRPLKLKALVGGGTAADAVVLVTTPVIVWGQYLQR